MSESTRSKSRTASSETRAKSGSTSGRESSGRNSQSASGSSDLTAQSQEVVGQAQEQAQNLVNTAREQATSQLATQKDRAADSLTSIASALQVTSRELRNQNGGPIADYIDTAASQVDQFATALHDQDISQLLKTTEQFARRQPALFLAAAFALGFAGTRFLRSSSPASDGSSRGYGSWESRDRSNWQSSGSYGTSGAYGSGGSYGGAYGSRSTSSTAGGRYGSDAYMGGETRLTGAAGSKSGNDWQAGSGFNAGPEGQ